MTADVCEAVFQRWSVLQLLIRNSNTGPVWPTDGWMQPLPASAFLTTQTFVLGRFFVERLHGANFFIAAKTTFMKRGEKEMRDVRLTLTLSHKTVSQGFLKCNKL